MFRLKGKVASALITTDNVEQTAIEQIKTLLDSEAAEGIKVAIMPDVHAGKGCTIGTVMTFADRVVPNLVGVDIGCGVYAYKIGEKGIEIDFAKLQKAIDDFVPSGRNVHARANQGFDADWAKFKMKFAQKDLSHFRNSIGTLGGGNHFISIEVGESGAYLLIHSGSRNLGAKVARHYQDLAVESFQVVDNQAIIADLKAQGREREIYSVLAGVAASRVTPNPDLAYLQGEFAEDYLNDMNLAARYADLNRFMMAYTICHQMGWVPQSVIKSVHNYIDVERRILRKGAVAAYRNEPFLVPLNMKDGTLIFVAEEENADWLYSAPHGAGRVMSRNVAKAKLNMEDYVSQMDGIWTASLCQATLDEAPGAYKPAKEIEDILREVYTYQDHLVPVFNFKARE